MGETTPSAARGELVVGGTEPCAASAMAYSGALWIGQCGKALGYEGTKKRIVEATRATIGVPISPHDFRRNGATTAAFRPGPIRTWEVDSTALRSSNERRALQPRFQPDRCR